MITIISCGVTNGHPPPGDLVYDCTSMPDPSPVILDLPGTASGVLDIIADGNPMVRSALDFLELATHRLQAVQEDVVLVLVCSAGWHRSVAAAQEVGRRLSRHHPEGVRVLHRDLTAVSP